MSTASMRAGVRASFENVVTNFKLWGTPCVSTLRAYVRTVQITSEIQNSVKNPYFASDMGVNMEGYE
jgi:hypothetical protein